MSLTRHLTSSSAVHGRLAFHPDCPRCGEERLYGDLGADPLAGLRTQAAVAAGALVFSAAAPPATAVAGGPPDQEQEGSTDPGAEMPGIEPEFDPGDDGDHDDFETGPNLGGDQDNDDESTAPPVEPEPYSTPEPEPYSTPDAPAPPDPGPLPEPPLAPVPPAPQAVPLPPVAAPTPAPPAAPSPAPAPAPEATRRTARNHKPNTKSKQRGETEAAAPAPVTAPVPSLPPVVVEQTPASGAAEVVTVSESAPEPAAAAPAADRRAAGASYRVRPGDSLWSIARRMSVAGASNGQLAREVARLWRLNEDRIGTGDPSMLHVGTVLRLR